MKKREFELINENFCSTTNKQDLLDSVQEALEDTLSNGEIDEQTYFIIVMRILSNFMEIDNDKRKNNEEV